MRTFLHLAFSVRRSKSSQRVRLLGYDGYEALSNLIVDLSSGASSLCVTPSSKLKTGCSTPEAGSIREASGRATESEHAQPNAGVGGGARARTFLQRRTAELSISPPLHFDSPSRLRLSLPLQRFLKRRFGSTGLAKRTPSICKPRSQSGPAPTAPPGLEGWRSSPDPTTSWPSWLLSPRSLGWQHGIRAARGAQSPDRLRHVQLGRA